LQPIRTVWHPIYVIHRHIFKFLFQLFSIFSLNLWHEIFDEHVNPPEIRGVQLVSWALACVREGKRSNANTVKAKLKQQRFDFPFFYNYFSQTTLDVGQHY
jgi:hypothetical protein